jgi:hypothetical protein
MKKVFTLFAAALLGFCAYAQETCPTVPELTLLNGDDAANVELELGLKVNNSANLNGFNFEFTKPHDATWKRAQGANYFSGKGYARYILGAINLDGATADDFTDAELEEMLPSMADIKSNAKQVGDEKNLVVIVILSTNDCRFFPAFPGVVGKCKIDMSTLADGEYEIKAENTPATASMSYTGGPEGSRAWTIDEPLTITLVKEGNVVTEKADTPQPVEYNAFYVTGTFNEWSEDVANMTELVANADGNQFTGSVVLADGAEFKVVSPLEEGLKWFGGVDENQVGYFEINDGLLDQPIELVDGSNFKVVGDGKYTITVMNPAKGLQEPLVMTVSKESTGINTIGVDSANGRIYDLQGRELKSVPEHGIYIQNGKKYVK